MGMNAELQELWLACNGRLIVSTSNLQRQMTLKYGHLVEKRYKELVEPGESIN